ncbi:MAG: tRNA (adenosine(37)-N6)-threonylcarbamoyltransferase complex dimerization subunit type 1 TsaB [Proteobacteria bacterium]|nr:tRNA (adenosine(37)-N6)-threonylcarbamoyltransferase complex dimerization subunit type 1 TsaB [Pseudomonadota bacterium]
MENRIVLGIDNSMDFLSIALSMDDKLIEERHVRNKKAPSEILPVEISHILSNNGYTINDVKLLVVTLGPGSFTGIRVGIAFCKGLNAGGNIPLVGVSTLDALASSFSFMEGQYLFPLIDAKKSEVFSSMYYVSDGCVQRLTDYCSMRPEKLMDIIKTPCICFGTGTGLCKPFLSGMRDVRIIREGFSKISGEALIKEGLKSEFITGKNYLEPIYCRKSEAEIKFNITVE